MCVNFDSPDPQQMRANFNVEPPFQDWKAEIWQDYPAPIIISRDGQRTALTASYGLIPKDKNPPGVKLTTLNARAETVGEKRSYKRPWMHSQLCLVPMTGFYEPNYESGRPVRWRIRLADDKPFAVAGLWHSWDMDTDEPRYSFTQLTINADEHPLMKRFHKPGEEKRSLVVLAAKDYDDWLNCHSPEIARTFLQLYPAALMTAVAQPTPPRKPKADTGSTLI